MAETYYALTDIVKLIDNLIAAMPTSFYCGIMAVRGGLVTAPAADVVARDCYDRLLAENDELRKERPVRHGRWIWNPDGMDWGLGAWCCSECGSKAETWWANDSRYNPLHCSGGHFCGNCGARMDLVMECNQVKDGDEE